jgi:LysR family glycine cleavage system transcriptional activator
MFLGKPVNCIEEGHVSRRLPSIQSLIAFDAVAKNGGFTKAADDLCLTHGAITHRIRALEDFVGARLFSRSHSGARLTSDGIDLMESVGKALSLIESGCSPKNKRGHSSSVTISVLPHFASAWLLRRIQDFNEHHPDIDLRLDASYELASFSRGGVDVAIRYGPGNWPKLASIKLLDEEVFPVCSPSYAALRGPFSRPDQLSSAILLRYSREPWKPWFEAAGLPWKEPSEGPFYSDFGLLLDAAVMGFGIALGRKTIVENDLECGRLTTLFGEGIRAPFSYYIVYPRSSAPTPQTVEFIDWLRSNARGRDLDPEQFS